MAALPAKLVAAPDPAPEHARIAALMADSLASLSAQDSPTDPQLFASGTWKSADTGCWTCQVGPGTAAAYLWRERRDGLTRWLAVQTFDTAIATYRNPNGSFGPADESPDIATMFFGLELGHAYLVLKPTLGATRAAAWRRAIAGGADFLIANGNLGWYTNGNINLGNTMLFYLAWRATGEPRFRAAYETAWDFTLRPPQDRWPGFGLRYLRTPKAGDGRDGAAYLAESGGRAPGFDPEYTQVQADFAGRLYLLTGDPRVLRLTNLLVNAVLTRTDGQWLVDTSGGTRHPIVGRHVPFLSPALDVLVRHGERPDLASVLGSQLDRIEMEYRAALHYSHHNYYRGLGGHLSVILESSLAPTAIAQRTPNSRTPLHARGAAR